MESVLREPVKTRSVFLVMILPVILCVLASAAYAAGIIFELYAAGVIVCAVFLLAAVILPLVILSKMFKDLNVMCEGDERHTMAYIGAWLLGTITMEFFTVYYLHAAQSRLYYNADRYDAEVTTKPSTVLIWFLVGYITCGIGWLVAWIMVIRNFNRFASAYNGEVDFYAEAEDPQMVPVIPSEPAIAAAKCMSGTVEGKEIGFTESKSSVILGRNPEYSDFVILNNKVSQKHCEITFDKDAKQFSVTDCGSTNGMLIKGERGTIKPKAGEPVVILEGDTLVLPDNITFMFEISE